MADRDVRGWWSRLGLVLGGVVALLAGAAVVGPSSAWAHGDPTLFSVLREVRPVLPDGVTLGVRKAESAQLVLANPTPTPMSVLDPAGKAFLRVSAAGVDGDVASPFLHAGAARAAATGAETWVRLSAGSAWAWSDPRIDPPILPDPDQPVGGNRARIDLTSREIQVLSSWQVGLRYGAAESTATGVIERRPFLGQVSTAVTGAPAGVTATVVEGPSPALRLEIPDGSRVEVLGRDGRVFLRMAPDATTVRTDSPEYLLHREILMLSPPDGDAAWVPMGTPRKVSWVDARLRYDGGPPGNARTAVEPVELARWRVPVIVNGQPGEIAGSNLWIPSRTVVVAPDARGPGSLATVLLCVAAVTLSAAGLLAYRVARRRAAASTT